MSIEQTLSRGGLLEDMAMAGCDWPNGTAGLYNYKQLPLVALIDRDETRQAAVALHAALASAREGPYSAALQHLDSNDYAKRIETRTNALMSCDLDGLFRNHVYKNLSPPYSVQPDELHAAFLQYMRVGHDDFHAAYDLFVTDIAMSHFIRYDGECLGSIFLAADMEGSDNGPDENWLGRCIWQRANVVELTIAQERCHSARYRRHAPGSHPDDVDDADIAYGSYPTRELRIEIAGEFTRDTASLLESEFRTLLATIDWVVESATGRVDSGSLVHLVPILEYLIEQHALTSLAPYGQTISAFDRRISNAMNLLTAAHREARPELRMVMCVTAIEAMLPRKRSGKPGITKWLSDQIPLLLEPDPTRHPESTQFVKDVYGHRSDFMHGRTVQVDPQWSRDAKTLASSILWALIHHRLELGWQAASDYAHISDFDDIANLFRRLAKPESDPLHLPSVETFARSLWDES